MLHEKDQDEVQIEEMRKAIAEKAHNKAVIKALLELLSVNNINTPAKHIVAEFNRINKFMPTKEQYRLAKQHEKASRTNPDRKLRRDWHDRKQGYLTVKKLTGYRSASKHLLWECVCDCGNECVKSSNDLSNGVISCGRTCPKTHGRKVTSLKPDTSTTIERRTWLTIIKQCSDPTALQWHKFGAKGIQVQKEWVESYDNFLQDMGPAPVIPAHLAALNMRSSVSLRRINPNKNFTKDNCGWSVSKPVKIQMPSNYVPKEIKVPRKGTYKLVMDKEIKYPVKT